MPEIYKKPEKTNVSHFRASIASFLTNPTNIKFETQEDGENIIIFMRAHPITNVYWLFITFVLIILPIFLFPIILSSKIVSWDVPWGYFIIIPLLYYLGVLEYAFTNFLKWYFNVYIVTSTRIVDIDWVSLLYKKFATAKLDKIQDVSYKQGGLIDSFFNFGNVYVQTAGEELNFEFERIPNPDQVVRKINEILGKNTNSNP